MKDKIGMVEKKEEMECDRKNFGKVLISTVILVAFVTVGSVSAATITVCPSGCDHTSIQAAIDAAEPGDTIEDYENVYVNKHPILSGVDTGGGKPVVDAGGIWRAIELRADGFTVTNSGLEGIWVKKSNDNIITGNDVTNSGDGICLENSNSNTITNNNVSNSNGYGIYLF